MSDMEYKNTLLAGIRQGLEEGLTKQASDGQLSEQSKAWIDQTLVEFEKSAGLGDFLKTMATTAVSNSPHVTVGDSTRNTYDAAGALKDRTYETNLINPAAKAGIAAAEGFGSIMPRVMVPLGVGLGIMAAAKATKAIIGQVDKSKFDKVLAEVLQTNEMLKGADPAKIQSIAQSIFRLAPSIATDPNLLSTVLQNQINNSSGFDLKIGRELVDIEDKLRNRSSLGLKPKEFLAG